MNNKTISNHTFDKIIKIHNYHDDPWYDMLSHFQITYEYCSGSSSDDFCNILMISPTGSNYRTIPVEHFAHFNARPVHKHNFFEFLIVLRGNTIQKIEGKEFMYPAGSCCLINRNLAHAEKFSEETELLFIGLSADFVTELSESYKTAFFHEERELSNNFIFRFWEENLISDEGKSYLDFFPKHQKQTYISRILHQISDALIHTASFPKLGTTYMIKGLICSLLQHLNDESIYHHTLVKLDSNADLLLFSRITHLLEDADGRMSRSELEKLLNYNGSYLNSIVKRHTGMCLFDYGMTFCLKKAALLLSSTDESVSSISAKLHFSNRTHFYKLFKEKYGVTPKEYQKSFRNA